MLNRRAIDCKSKNEDVAASRAGRDTSGMDDEELVRRLKERGYTLGDSAVRDDGRFLWQVNETFMFRQDAIDLATGAAMLGDILERNEGKVFPNAPHVGTSYRKFEEQMFQEIKDQEEAHKRKVVEDLVKRSEEHTSELQSRENLVCRL